MGERIKELVDAIEENTYIIKQAKDAVILETLSKKETLFQEEAALYLGIKATALYALMRAKEIPYYRPSGKKAYFKRVELDAWMQQTKVVEKADVPHKANHASL